MRDASTISKRIGCSMIGEANPLCYYCKGRGFDRVRDIVCWCTTRIEVVNPPPTYDRLSLDACLELEQEVRGLLVRAQKATCVQDARIIAHAAAQGNVPKSSEQLASFAGVRDDVATRVLDRIRAAFERTKKERSCTRPDTHSS